MMGLVSRRRTPTKPCDDVPERPEDGNPRMASVPSRKKRLVKIFTFFLVCCCFFSVVYFHLPEIIMQTFLCVIDSYVEEFNEKEFRMTKIKEDFDHQKNLIGAIQALAVGGFFGRVAGMFLLQLGEEGVPFTESAGSAIVAGGDAVLGAANHLADDIDAERMKILVIEFQNIGQPLVDQLGLIREMSKHVEENLQNQSDAVKTAELQNSLRKILELISKVFQTSWGEMEEMISYFRNIKYELLKFKLLRSETN